MADVSQTPYYERGGEQRAKMQERDTAAAMQRAAEQGERAYQPATSAQFVPEAAGTETREESDSTDTTQETTQESRTSDAKTAKQRKTFEK